MMRRRFRLRAAVMSAVLVAAALLLVAIRTPYRGFSGALVLEIPKGTSSWEIAGSLARQGVVRNRFLFLAARMLRPRGALQAGEYKFTAAASPWTVVGRLARGDVFYYEVTVREGANMFDIAAALGASGVIPPARFLAAARDPEPVMDLDPQAPSLEGYLFPATYRYTRSTTGALLAKEMVARFRKAWTDLKPPPGASAHRIVTLASMVEKETAQPPERPLIAAVFLNRLRAGMTLDCDPTTIYAALLEERFRGAIYRSDLARDHPYNTYRHSGLPPGPIANPSLASLAAVLEPAATDYLYFVARPDGSGRHRFSRSLAEHQRAVAQYRRGQR